MSSARSKLGRKATFMGRCYWGDCDPNVEETKKMIEEEAATFRQRVYPMREEEDI